MCTDSTGCIWEETGPIHDPLIVRYLHAVKNAVDSKNRTLFRTFEDQLRSYCLGSLASLGLDFPQIEYLPTEAFALLENVHRYFPKHRLLLMDFSHLPNAIPGRNAPVVQCRFDGKTVCSSTLLVKPGMFDIFFPTDFRLLASVYQTLTGRPVSVHSHRDFMAMFADLPSTRTVSGFNPLLEDYANFAILSS